MHHTRCSPWKHGLTSEDSEPIDNRRAAVPPDNQRCSEVRALIGSRGAVMAEVAIVTDRSAPLDRHTLAGVDDYQDKSPAAGRMGKAAELLVAASCILATRGELNVSTSLVDDEGVDLVFHHRNSSATLAVQVKARMSDGLAVSRGRFLASARASTFTPRSDFDLLFVAVDAERGAITTAWLVPSADYGTRAYGPSSRGRYRFSASPKPDSQDQWAAYRLEPAELAKRILDRLGQLARDDGVAFTTLM